MPERARARIVLALLLAAIAAAGHAPAASAHAELLRSTPAENAALASAPREVRLLFSEPISREFSTATVTDGSGRPVRLSRLSVDGGNAGLVLGLPTLPAGVYTVSWSVLSAADGHPSRGLLVFGAGKRPGSGAASSAFRDDRPAAPEIVLRWLNFGLLAGLVGALVVALVVLPRADDDVTRRRLQHARLRVLTLGWLCGALALAVGVGLFWWQVDTIVRTLPDGASVRDVGWDLLTRSRWGTLWLVRQGLLVALVVILLGLSRAAEARALPEAGRRLGVVAGALAVALVVVQALAGHAAGITPDTSLAVAVAAVHLLAGAVWIGGLLALVVALGPYTRGGGAALVGASLRRFGSVAVVSVAAVAASGLYYAGRQVASVDAALTTLYGQALIAKSALVLGAGALGLLNSILARPRLASPLARLLRRPRGWTPIAPARLPRLLLAETGAGLLVLAAVAVITASRPARGPEFAPPPGPGSTLLTQTAGDVLVSLAVKPNRPGENVFFVTAVSTRRPAPAPIGRVILRVSPGSADAGRVSVPMREVAPGRYRVNGSYLGLAGPWRIAVTVRRRGLEDSVGRFDWRVASLGSARRALVSDRPLGPPLTRAAALVALIALLAAAGLARVRRRRRPAAEPVRAPIELLLEKPVP